MHGFSVCFIVPCAFLRWSVCFHTCICISVCVCVWCEVSQSAARSVSSGKRDLGPFSQVKHQHYWQITEAEALSPLVPLSLIDKLTLYCSVSHILWCTHTSRHKQQKYIHRITATILQCCRHSHTQTHTTKHRTVLSHKVSKSDWRTQFTFCKVNRRWFSSTVLFGDSPSIS